MEDSPLLGFEFNHDWSSSGKTDTEDVYLLQYLQCDEMSSPFFSSHDEEEKKRKIKQEKISNYEKFRRIIAPHSRSSSNSSQWTPSEDESPQNKSRSTIVRPPPPITRSFPSSPVDYVDEEVKNEFNEEDSDGDKLLDDEASEERSDDDGNLSDMGGYDDDDDDDDDDVVVTGDEDDDEKEDFYDEEVVLDDDEEDIGDHSPFIEDRIPRPHPIFPQQAPRKQLSMINSLSSPVLYPSSMNSSVNIPSNNNTNNEELQGDLDRLMKLWRKNENRYKNIYRTNRPYIGTKRTRMFNYTARLHFELALRMGYRFGNYPRFESMDRGIVYLDYGVERTLFLTFHLLDLFFSSTHQLGDVYNRLICLTILYIAAKFEDVNIEVTVFQEMLVREGYEIELLRKMEFAMLFCLNKFDLVHATVYDFLQVRIEKWKKAMIDQFPPSLPPNMINRSHNSVGVMNNNNQMMFHPRNQSSNNNGSFNQPKRDEDEDDDDDNMFLNHPCVVPEIRYRQRPRNMMSMNQQQQQQQRLESERERRKIQIENMGKKLEFICSYIASIVVRDLLYLTFLPDHLVDMIFEIGHHLFIHNQLHPLMIKKTTNVIDGKEKHFKWILTLLRNEIKKKSFVSRKFSSNGLGSVSRKFAQLLS